MADKQDTLQSNCVCAGQWPDHRTVNPGFKSPLTISKPEQIDSFHLEYVLEETAKPAGSFHVAFRRGKVKDPTGVRVTLCPIVDSFFTLQSSSCVMPTKQCVCVCVSLSLTITMLSLTIDLLTDLRASGENHVHIVCLQQWLVCADIVSK